ncbi:hypothetical protein [Streptomyces sp. NPDC058644]|uniref:hypothetical protein n=1 Tax=unclassified Streptomyces TaxID=2593676 RepID=UPI00365AC721
MSDLESIGNPDHVCGKDCAPYVPMLDRDLEDLEESEHIDALYAEVDLTREHGALLLLALRNVSPTPVLLPARALAVLLDLDEAELAHEMGAARGFTPAQAIDFAVRAQGEDGYVGRALEAIFRAELAGSG